MTFAISAEQLVVKKNTLTLLFKGKEECHNNEILVTGGSGFLGVHLLQQLVSLGTFSKIHTVVRSKIKFINQIKKFQLDMSMVESINIIEGDLHVLSELDLPNVEFVIHSAAQIHCLKSLSQLWKDNVLLTHKICSIYRLNQVLFISTLSVFVSSNKKGVHQAKPLNETNDYVLYGGYAQSKYIGEKIAGHFGHKIVRLGLLTGASKTGIFPGDFFVDYIKALKSVGKYPEHMENAWVDITPVDYCAAMIIESIRRKEAIIHIANKKSLALSAIVKALCLQEVPIEVWENEIKKFPSLTQYLLNFSFFKSKMLETHFHYFNLDLFQSTGHKYGIIHSFKMNNEDLLNQYIHTLESEQNNATIKV